MLQSSVTEPRGPSRFERRPGPNSDAITRRDEALAFDSAWLPPEWFAAVSVVLVRPADAVNIGTATRAMANTGFSSMRLVEPGPHDPWDIIGVAHYTQHIVEATRTFATVKEAVADAHLVIGLTGKHHRDQRNPTPFAEALDMVAEVAQAGERVALVFGTEDMGLSNEDLDLCQRVTTVPTNPAYPSLNLAQAVLLTLHPLFMRSGGGDQPIRGRRRAAPLATSDTLQDLLADLERALEAMNFFKDRSRTGTIRSLQAVLYRSAVDDREAALIRSAILQLRRLLVRNGLSQSMGPVGRMRPEPASDDFAGR